MKVEKLNAKNISAALSLINRTYADVHGFTPLTESDWNIEESASCFLGFLDEKLVSLAYGPIAEKDKGRVRWACSRENARSKCYTLLPMERCIIDLKYKGAKQIRVDSWLDAPYRRMLSHFESKGIHVEHDHLLMRLDMRQYRRQLPALKSGYTLRTFRSGDQATWANVKNAVFGSSSEPKAFWKQDFQGVKMTSDFDPKGFFFAEKDGQLVGICAGLVLHNRQKMGGTFPGSIGWTGILEGHRGIGLGRALMMSALNYLDDKGIKITEIGTQFYRTAAVNLYESLGFRIHTASFNLL